MDSSFEMNDDASAGLSADTAVIDGIGLEGAFEVECRDESGELKWKETFSNLVVNAGLDHALDVTLSGAAQSTSWYLGLVDGGTSPTFDAGDTIGSHSGWSENTDYSESNRQGWTDGGVSSQSVDNSGSPASFSINATADIAGAFLVDDNTKGGTSGTLFAEGSFGATRSVANGDTLNVTYTINAS
jgi:hypothetical protein